MPLYEYQCEACGHRGEELQKHADPVLTVCPVCGGAYKKLISAPAFQFKGSGWYVTDYARKGQGEKKESAEAKVGESAKTDGAKKEEGGATKEAPAGAKSGDAEKKTSAASS